MLQLKMERKRWVSDAWIGENKHYYALHVEYARVQIDNSSETLLANLYPKQGSDVMSSVVWADGIIEIPEDTVFEKGTILNYYPMNELTR